MKFQEIILTQTKIDIGLLLDINNKKLKDHCLKYKKNITRKRGNEITDTLSEDSDIPKHPEIEKMLNKINEQYFFNYKKNLILDEFWGHIHDKNQSSILHHHVNPNNLSNSPDISGVYYVSVPKESGVIVFQYSENKFLEKRYWIEPKEGLFILFPSSLPHFITRHGNDRERISISFNFKIKV